MSIFHRPQTKLASQSRSGFGEAKSGAVALLLGLTLFPLLLLGGGAVDYELSVRVRAKLHAAIDSAVLAGASTSARMLKSGSAIADAQNAGYNAAYTTFQASAKSLPSAQLASFTITPTVDAVSVNFTGSATANVNTSFLKLIGIPTLLAAATSTASTASPSQYIDIYLMVDTSGSMMLGATQSDINKLIGQFNCAFACHDGSSVTPVGDYYQWAIANGVTLRYQALFDGVTALVNYINVVDPSHTKIRLAIYSFDSALNLVQPLSYNFGNFAASYPQPAIDSSNLLGATLFNENIGTVLSAIGTSGDGTSSATPSKLLIIASDGVEDPGRQWVSDTTLRPLVTGFDTSFCQTAKNSAVSVAIINTPYLPMTWDWGYNATLGMPASPGPTRVDNIPPSLQSCVSNPSLFVSASDAATIRTAFTSLFQNFKGARLSR
jgi:Flp pilus assembly protein TadG